MGEKSPIPYVHSPNECGGAALAPDNKEPPAADRYGNRFVSIECATCGARDSLLLHKHGEPTPPEGWQRIET